MSDVLPISQKIDHALSGKDLSCVAAGCTRCVNSFRRFDIVRVHWECWSQCNLSCSFCYRTRSVPLRGDDAVELVQLIAYGGARDLVFAGGDPALRRDLPTLCRTAKESGLFVEIQTNADIWSDAVEEALLLADSVALSLDGLASTHDALRGRKGNFLRVCHAMDWLEQRGVSFRVRTVVTRQNVTELTTLRSLLASYSHLGEWGIQELVQIGDAKVSWDRLHISDTSFDETFSELNRASSINIRAISSQDKKGTYAMVRSDGALYGTLGDLDGDFYPTVGDVRSPHLFETVSRLPFNPSRQSDRYGLAISPTNQTQEG
ncbi:radical SAM protein [Gordonia sp. AC31]|uniref:radical SAM protein n=1 Tax=Gordonia sp. AC31 TaxID=2962571 RepID=UPI002880D130|nr:radical SAM protein [Gordonia sp. AC31]MDT0223362.1 radical SAM protein [Gordonia sp. AC31]